MWNNFNALKRGTDRSFQIESSGVNKRGQPIGRLGWKRSAGNKLVMFIQFATLNLITELSVARTTGGRRGYYVDEKKKTQAVNETHSE